ncbi:MAG: chemotaxis protein CheW [Kofleriaceae bacterium]
MGELRNVIVFTLGAVRYALELRWVREVVSLGFVTGVPTAPSALAGVCNLHGTILPVLDLAVLLGSPATAPARQGDGALVIETDGVVCALRIDQVDHVASLHAANGAVRDAAGSSLVLLDPAVVVKRALEALSTPPQAGRGVPP